MPIGRMIRAKAIDDERLNSVSVEADFLFWKFIVACDRDGRLKGSPRYINKTFYGLRDYTDQQVEGWLHELFTCKKNGKGLVEIYEVEGRRYLRLPGFLHEQSGSWLKWVRQKEAPSIIPAPPSESPPTQAKPKQEAKSLDNDLSQCMKALEEALGKVNTPLDANKVVDLVEHYGVAKFKMACQKAKIAKARSINYIGAILEDKEKDGTDRQGAGKVDAGGLGQSIGKPLFK